jgi:hypothetical protein
MHHGYNKRCQASSMWLRYFCGKGKFSLWKKWMKNLLIQKGVYNALLKMTKKPKEMDKKATSAICLNVGDRIIHNILEAQIPEQVWIKLECLYIRRMW